MSTENKAEDTATTTPQGDIVINISLDKLQPFKHHAFKLYEGKRLDRMIESVRERGVIQPIIVRSIEGTDKFEIVSGHNRVQAAKDADLHEIPAIACDLTDDEAIILSNETNLLQRTFKTWDHSEKANSIFQFHDAVKRQGCRTNSNDETSGGNHQKSPANARLKTAFAYGESEHTIRLYLELFRLTDPLKNRLDSKEFGITSAQNLSHISEDGQDVVDLVLTENKGKCLVTVDNSKVVRKELENYTADGMSDEGQEVVKDRIRKMLTVDVQQAPVIFKTIKMEADRYLHLFSDKTPDEVITEIVEAVEARRKAFIPRQSKDRYTAKATPRAAVMKNNEIAI